MGTAVRVPRGKRVRGSVPSLYVVAALLCVVSPARAGDDPTRDPTIGTRTIVTLFPAGDVYPVYVADPQRPANAMLFRFNTQNGIPATAMRRTSLSAGGRFGFVRVETADRRSWQVSMDAGLDALFDTDHSDDAIGWDGNYGITVTTASGPWSLKVGVLHVSAHVGDEYEDRVHRTRIDYTREEVAVGVGWRPSPRVRVYGETAHSYQLLNPQQQPWRVQQGVEYELPSSLWEGRFAWYVAADLQSMQERSWRIDRVVQGGVVTRSSGHTYRLLIEYYNGRPPISEFFSTSEINVTFGLRIEL